MGLRTAKGNDPVELTDCSSKLRAAHKRHTQTRMAKTTDVRPLARNLVPAIVSALAGTFH